MTRINPEIKKLVDETFTTVTYSEHEKFLIYLAANFGWQHAIYRVKSILHDVDLQLSQMTEEQEYPDSADKVIAWLNDQACQGWIEDIEVDIFVDKFKKDFGL